MSAAACDGGCAAVVMYGVAIGVEREFGNRYRLFPVPTETVVVEPGPWGTGE